MIVCDDATDRPECCSLDRTASGATALLEVPLVLISVLDGARQEILGAHGLAKHGVQGKAPCALCRDVALSGRPIIVQDARSRLPPAARHGWGPLVLDGGRAGALAAFGPARRTGQSRDLLALRSLADAAGAVLDMQLRYRELHVRLESTQ